MNKPNLKETKGMLIAGIFSSQTVDSSGEIVELAGLNIDSFEEGKGVCNYEHLSASDAVGKEIIGHVAYVHKIYKQSDCEDDIQRRFFKENREKPYLFGIVRLLDAAGHENAKAIASFVRDSVEHGDPLKLGFSIEGSTVVKEGNVIKESIGRRVAATMQPANKNCESELISDPNAPEGYEKINRIEELSKKELLRDPLYHKIGQISTIAPIVINNQDNVVHRLAKNIAIISLLNKAIAAGNCEAAPSSRVQGSALQKEDVTPKVYSGTILAAVRDYDEPNFNRSKFKDYLKKYLAKASLPEVSDSFLDHFTDIAQGVKLKKSVNDTTEGGLVKSETAQQTANENFHKLQLLNQAQEIPVEVFVFATLIAVGESIKAPIREVQFVKGVNIIKEYIEDNGKSFFDPSQEDVFVRTFKHLKDIISQYGIDLGSAVKGLAQHEVNAQAWSKRREEIKDQKGNDPGPYKGISLPINCNHAVFILGLLGCGESIPQLADEGKAPYKDLFGKSEEFDKTISLRSALIMEQYIKDYGKNNAINLYYSHLVPKLLECAQHRQNNNETVSFLKKAVQLEGFLVDLRKDIRHVTESGHHVEMPEIYKVDVNNKGKTNPAGRFMTSNGSLYHLEDYHGLLNSMLPEGPINASTISKIHGLMSSPHFDVKEHPLQEEKEDIQLPVITKLPEPKRAAVFSYFRPGMSHPHTVEFSPDGAALDGNALSHDELALMLENARKGLGKITWSGSPLSKREDSEGLMETDEALKHIRAAVAAGYLHPSVERAVTKAAYEDPMIEGIGNKHAAQQFRNRGAPGAYASIDLNSFKNINDTYGHDAGDSAIKSFGNALKKAREKYPNVRLYRTGGDEFAAHAPTYEDMSNFLGHAREHVDALPPIGGVHKQSMSVGIGPHFEKADEAMYLGKKGKIDPVTGQKLYKPGAEPHFGVSLYPGREGEVLKTGEPKITLPNLPKPATSQVSP